MKKAVICAAVFGMLSQVGCLTTPTASAGGETVIPPPPEGNLKYTITVSKFKNEANWGGGWDVGDGFTTVMTDALQQSGYFIVLGDKEMREEAMGEQDLATDGRTAGGKKAPKTGRMTPAQLLVRGSITHVEDSASGKSGGLNFKGISIGGGGGKAEVNITVYVVDSATGQVKASTKVVGVSNSKGFSLGYSGSALGGLTGDVGGFKKDNVGKACENALGQAIVFLIKQLEKIQWEGSVVSATGDKIMINRGTREGVAMGATFEVGNAEEVVDPDTGEVLDVEMTKVATIQVTQVKEKIAYCTATAGSAKDVKKGMSVMPSK